MQEQVVEAFQHQWGTAPHAVARAPGRVNLIGEHIDYMGYGVLPMAIKQACYVAVGWQPAGDTSTAEPCCLHAATIQPQLYPPATLSLAPGAGLPPECPDWLKYVYAAYRGCVEFAAAKQAPVPADSNLLLMVGSDIPAAAGLSSSSALVVATALSLLQLWGIAAAPEEVAEFTRRCERFVGTEGGGMDQAASLLAQEGRALHVEFDPVRAHPVPLPPGAVAVVANSLAPSAKAETASTRFNLRVLECRLAAMLLAHKLHHTSAAAGADGGENSNRVHSNGPQSPCGWQQVSKLKQVEAQLLQWAAAQHSCSGSSGAGAGVGEMLSAAVQQLLPQASYTLEQVVAQLGVAQQQLLDSLPQGLQAAAAAAPCLKLQQRACHVFSEAHRVAAFRHVCESQQPQGQQQQQPQGQQQQHLQQLGELMNASHSSCAQLYECSCEELDTLVHVARDAGALGARLTGAGWGGCIVALMQQEAVENFLQHLQQHYYQPMVVKGTLSPQDLGACLFASSLAAGAAVTVLRPRHT